MAEYITKADLLQHEKEASERAKVTSDKEQKLRHDLRDQVHKDYAIIDEKVWNNDKELALLKQSHNTMSENIQEIKKDMKQGFSNMEKQMEDFLVSIKDWYATKAEYKENSTKINWVIKIIYTIWLSVILWGWAFIWNFLITK